MRIAVYGANGFQGKLTAAELVRQGAQTVLVGRSQERLARAAAELDSSAVDMKIAEAKDRRDLLRAFRGCDAVINCAGPFTGCAAPIIKAAIAAGCHYVDTAGEQGFVKSVFDNFSGEAEKAGVTVLPSGTDGAVPGDLVAHIIGTRTSQIDSIIIAHKIVGGGGPSRGSLRSVVETHEDIADGGLTYEDGAWRKGQPLDRSTMAFFGEEEVAISKFPLVEAITIPRHVRARRVAGVIESSLAKRLSVPLSEQMIRAVSNPSPEQREDQSFLIALEATSTDGSVVRGAIEGADTYGTTAVIAVECARRLVEGQAPSGVLAASQAFEPVEFLDYLAAYNVRWRIEGSKR
ncbi:saccharopine dehydrogenase NADP-binding domain-containing protein [Rhizobium sp. AB2/73]|uniref:saccharopine dehydrogenase family protein n=1 Tax=Rhizobium sp. AB2/73 TaxID=2795216 RepID=UPI001C5F961B|nr:saccharopine dehydrogenase NADP-binding domain-containing protein [Rhizobium sp. AB2/73]QYA11935.1 saccharopine dehydrogenase NADP-binding domain-containing protein [Rhizobium sp. AB2/73]UEQ82134.1 saccharopine dehydrogenase NADP-binding domain-containing protein [Rhizobium sp. AB2/73]